MYFALGEFHIGHLPLVLLFLKLDSHRTPELLLVTQSITSFKCERKKNDLIFLIKLPSLILLFR